MSRVRNRQEKGEVKRLLNIRKAIKKIKPDFAREDSHRRPRLSRTSWRKPKGLHSKIRHRFKGNPHVPERGYRAPRAVRGLDFHGLRPVHTFKVKDLKGLNPELDSIVVPGTLGLRKRLQLVEEAKKLNLKVSNIKDIEAFLSEASKRVAERHKLREKTIKVKGEKAAEVSIEEKLEEKKEEKVDEERRKEEKKEMDAVLTKKG